MVPPAATLTAPTDPDLAALLAAWPTLAPAMRAGIVAMVKAAGTTHGDATAPR